MRTSEDTRIAPSPSLLAWGAGGTRLSFSSRLGCSTPRRRAALSVPPPFSGVAVGPRLPDRAWAGPVLSPSGQSELGTGPWEMTAASAPTRGPEWVEAPEVALSLRLRNVLPRGNVLPPGGAG